MATCKREHVAPDRQSVPCELRPDGAELRRRRLFPDTVEQSCLCFDGADD